jgi:NitT/TauT family transport system ATP-binding protein
MASAQVTITSLHHRFFDLEVLDGITMNIGSGELIALIGPSGCGKTTLLKIIGGLLTPSQGTLLIDGLSADEARSRGTTGFVFQDPVLLPWRTVRANVSLPFELADRKASRQNGHELVDSIIAMVGLTDFSQAYPHELSGGMQQRVALARALAHNPRLLLLDEPFSSLDELLREKLNFELLRLWNTARQTIVLVTHDIAEAVILADKVFILGTRPARLKRELQISLGRPRERSMISSKAFVETIELIRDELQ